MISNSLLLAIFSEKSLPCGAFEVNPPEVISHTLLARLILESPSRAATRQNKTGMAFLADHAVEHVWESSEEQNSQSHDQRVDVSVSARLKDTATDFSVDNSNGSEDSVDSR